MSVKRTVLEALSRNRLIDIAYEFDAGFAPTGMRKAKLVDGLASLPRTGLSELLTSLSRDELKFICDVLDLDRSGREKLPLIERILEADGGMEQPTTASSGGVAVVPAAGDQRSRAESADTAPVFGFIESDA